MMTARPKACNAFTVSAVAVSLSRIEAQSADLQAAAAQEMGINLVRAAYSTVVREARDCSAALLDTEGNVIAQAEMIPMMLAALGECFRACTAHYPVAEVRYLYRLMLKGERPV